MFEIEDGEILSDDGDDAIKEDKQSNPIDVYNVTTRPERSYPFNGNGHRGVTSKEITYSDDDSVSDSSCSDEDGSPIAKKLPRTGTSSFSNGPGYKKDPQWLAQAHHSVLTQKGKKVNNIWGSVIQEEDMSKFVNQLNRNDAISYEERGAESYDYTQAKAHPRLFEDEESDSETSEEDQGPADLTEKETFGFVVDKPKKQRNIKQRLGSKTTGNSDCQSGDNSMDDGDIEGESKSVKSRLGNRKEHKDNKLKDSHVKSRLGKKRGSNHNKDSRHDENNEMEVDAKDSGTQNKNYLGGKNKMGKNQAKKRSFHDRNNRKPRHDDVQVKEMKKIEVNEAMDDMELVDTVLDALREPQEQTDLFLKILDELGREKLIKLFKATEDIEEMGGLMIQNGSRRRTPGGVFLLLVRKDTDITKEQVDAIFADQNSAYMQKRKEERKERKKLTRRLKREEMLRAQKATLSAMDTGDVIDTVDNVKVTESKGTSEEEKPAEVIPQDEGELDNEEELIDIQLV